MFKWLKGRKTFIVVAIGVIVNGLFAMDYIDEKSIDIVNMILGFLGMGAIRLGIKKAEK